MWKGQYKRITDKRIYHKVPQLIFTRRRHDHVSVSYQGLRDLFFLSENWRGTYRTTVWFNDYMKKPCTGNSHKIVGKKNIQIRHREKWRRL